MRRSERSALFFAALGLTLLAPDASQAQVAHLVCSTSDTPYIIRAEEKTAQLLALVINCVKSDPDLPAPGAEVAVDISVTVDVPVTNNKNFGQGSNIVDAVAVINGVDCEIPSPVGGGSNCENIHQDPQYGRLLSDGRTIVWESMVVPFPGEKNVRASALTNPSVTTIRLFSVRINAATLGIPESPAESSGGYWNDIYADFSASPSNVIDLSESNVVVGSARRGLRSSVLSIAEGLQCEDVVATAKLEVGEWFTNAMREEGEPTIELVGWGPYIGSTESGHFAPGSYNGGGATGPTQIGLTFSGIPSGVAISLPKAVQSKYSQNVFSMALEGSQCGDSGMRAVEIGSSGKGSVTYRVCTAFANGSEKLQIPVALSWTGGPGVGAGTGKVQVSYVPSSGAVPSFVKNGSATNFLTVQQCATPPPPVEPPPPVDPPPPAEETRITKLGVYNDGHWMRDSDGDGQLDAGDSETSFGFKGAMPLTGDWDGDHDQEIAVYANIFGTGLWFRDINGNGNWDENIDQLSLLGWANTAAKPIVGDWNGDGRSKIGVYSNGLWLLDYDGDGKLTGADKVFQFGGWEGSVPLVGDWNGDGRDSAGIYVPGRFVLDYNADHHFENGSEDRIFPFGITGDNVVPVIGDWNGDGKKQIGIFRAGQWLLDLNGDGKASGTGESLFFFGPKEGSPVVGDWTGIGKDTIGVIDDGAWYLDVNGDRVHNGQDPILFWGDEGENRIFVPGKWQSPQQ